MRLQGREEWTIITSAVVLAARLKLLWFEKEASSGLLSSNVKICNLLQILKKISNVFTNGTMQSHHYMLAIMGK